MPLRVVSSCEKIIEVDHTFDVPIVCAANTATDVLPDILSNPANPGVACAPPNYEVAARYIQNIGANIAYFSYGADCEGLGECNGAIAAGAQMNATDCGQRISINSPAGTTISRLVLLRKDMTNPKRIAGRANA